MSFKNLKKSVAVCIDPGLAGTGFALFGYNSFVNKQCELIHNKSIVRKQTEGYLTYLEDICDNYHVLKIYCEGQAYMRSDKGTVAASSGALVKLANFAGSIQGFAWCNEIPFEYVPVHIWKGQLSKDVVKHRIKAVLPDIKCTSHDWDAVGIGLYLIGHINKNR